VLLPLVGEQSFATIAEYGKVAHNFTSFAFMLGLALMIVQWLAQNLPSRVDGEWIRAGGGILKAGVHPPARKFNAGQKLIFWLVIAVGIALSWTGIELLFDGGVVAQGEMQSTVFLHSILAIALVGVIFAHIYIGTLGMQGAFSAMGTGQVDENWAKQHHSLWVEETKEKKLLSSSPQALPSFEAGKKVGAAAE
jgi:formate dehydrogenase subunit gamma